MKGKNLEVVLIDFFGTIADGDRHAVETTCACLVRDFDLPLTAPELAQTWGREFFATADASNHHEFKTLYVCEEISLSRTMKRLGVDMDPTPYVDQVWKYWCNPPLHGEAKEALTRIPVPVCCVSNVDEADLQAAASAHGLRFDHTVTSERARSYKPDPRIFELALQEMGVDADRCIHVGDSLHSDIAGAQRLGIGAIWVQRDGRISDIGTAEPDWTIRSLMDLEQLFQDAPGTSSEFDI